MLTSILESVSDYVIGSKVWEDNLLSESEFADNKHKLDIAEGDAYKIIKEVWVVAISGATFGVTSRVKVEIELRKAKEKNQQFREEWMKYSKMQWQSNEG